FDHINPRLDDSTATSFATPPSRMPVSFGSRDQIMPQPSFESAAYWTVNEWDDGASGASTPSLTGSTHRGEGSRQGQNGERSHGEWTPASGSEFGADDFVIEGIDEVRSFSGTDGWSEVGSEVSSGNELH